MTEHQLKEFYRTGFMPSPEHFNLPKARRISVPCKSKLEIWLDFHNHEMELIRTLVPFVVLIVQTIILIKVM